MTAYFISAKYQKIQ